MGLSVQESQSKANRDASIGGGFGISGLKELQDTLNMLPAAIAKGALRGATSKAMTPVSKSAKANVRQQTNGTGLLAKSIGKKTRLYRMTGSAVTIVGPRKGFKAKVGERRSGFREAYRTGRATQDTFRNPSNYAHLVERGFRRRMNIRGKLVDMGREPARPFLAPALRHNRGTVVTIFKREIGNGIRKRVAKAMQGDKARMAAAIARLDSIEKGIDR